MAIVNTQDPNQPHVVYHWVVNKDPSFSRDPSDIVRVYHRSPIPPSTIAFSESWEPVPLDQPTFTIPLYLHQHHHLYEYLHTMWGILNQTGNPTPTTILHVVQDNKFLGFFTTLPLEAPNTPSKYERDLLI